MTSPAASTPNFSANYCTTTTTTAQQEQRDDDLLRSEHERRAAAPLAADSAALRAQHEQLAQRAVRLVVYPGV